MRDLQLGDRVIDVRGRHVGNISDIQPCCIAVGAIRIVPDAVLQINDSSVELICDADQLARYACSVHAPDEAEEA
ncbi:MAG: hypothetical protein AB7J35_09750 [Dehalococcoidia bacterium]